MSAQQNAPPSLMTARILWGAMLASNVVYVIITFILKKPEGFELVEESFMPIALALTGVSVIEIIPTLFARKFFLKQFKEKQTGPVAPSEVAATYQTGSIITWALAESISINGFVLYMLSYEQWIIFPFVALGVLLMLVTMPRQSHIDDIMRECSGLDTSGTSDNPALPPDGASW